MNVEIKKLRIKLQHLLTKQTLPWALLSAAVVVFLLFIINLQQQNNVDNILKKLKENKEIIGLDEWQALPYHCPHMSQSLKHCELLSSTETTITFPRTEHFFPRLVNELEEKGTTTKKPNAARLRYQFKINELDWLRHPKRANTLLFSLVIPRTSQDLMFVYTDPSGATQHGGRQVNVVANFGRDDLLQSSALTIDIIAPSYERQFGPQTLPIALMTPSRTTAYLNLLQQMKSSSLPATLLSLMLPVLAAAMAVILDSSKIMFHISGYAFLKGLQAILAQTLNSLDGRGFSVLGLPISLLSLRFVFFITISSALTWLIYVIFTLLNPPLKTLSFNRRRNHFLALCTVIFATMGYATFAINTPITTLERIGDLIIGIFTAGVAGFSAYAMPRISKYKNNESEALTLESDFNLFNPIHFLNFRTLLVTATTALMALASFKDLRVSLAGTMVYDPLDWRQLILVPVLLLCAILGVGSVTQKMNEYAQMMRRRVELLMIGSRTLASSTQHIAAVLAALKIISEEIRSLSHSQVEILLPTTENKKLLSFDIKMSNLLEPEDLPKPQEKEGAHPLPDEHQTKISGRVLTIQLFKDLRWLGTLTLECAAPVYLTHEEKHFIDVTQQTLCLTLDNLTAIGELRRADKLKDEFLANTSHELRTPLHGIVGIAEALIAGPDLGLSARTRENMNLIAISGRRLTNLVNDLLDFSQIKQRELKLRISHVELRPMVQLVLALSKPLLGGKPVELHNNVEPNLNPLACDEARLQQILQNLIGNAIKFTHAGQIIISAQLEDRMIRVSVKDTGIGIHPSKRHRIFNSFEQADGNINRVYGGTGLGLTITKQLVEMHGGTIQVESVVDEGSVFSFTLPAARFSERQDQLTSSPQLQSKYLRPNLLENQHAWWEYDKSTTLQVQERKPASSANARNHKVLIVDDDPINRVVLENQLQSDDYEIRLAEDGLQALQILATFKPDIVLLDLMMPRMSGLEVITEIRKTAPASLLPVLILTAKNQINDLVSSFHAGANDFLMKPFAQSELLSRMRNHLHMSKMHGAYSRFIPQDFLDLLGRDSIVNVRLGDQVMREMTVMFLDIRQFSKISESLTPKENFDFLNEYFATVNPVIRKHKGFIDKYIGDAVMALFSTSPDDALLAGIDLLNELENYNNKRKTTFKNPIAIGIGMHHGSLMLGTLGNEERMEGTVIADSVNVASRLESMTKIFSVGLITSHDSLILANNPDQFNFRSLGRVRPPGFTRSLNIVEVFNSDTPHIRQLKIKTLERHEQSLRAFHAMQWDSAINGWKAILDENPADKVAALYLDRALRYKQTPPQEDWDGVFEMRSR